MHDNFETVGVDYDYDNDSTWMIDVSGYHTTCIRNYLIGDGIPEDGADMIISNAARVLGYCPDPSSREEKNLTGIVIGKVQSGKTSNFIARFLGKHLQ